MTGHAAITKVLCDGNIINENGDQMMDFVPKGRDALDFATVSRWQLERMLMAAYSAGRADARKK